MRVDEPARMADEPAHLAVLDDRYRLEEVIGRGGMADVYRAVDVRLDRVVAVKCLRESVAGGPDEARARNEAQVLAGLSHPGLVMLFDAGVEAGRPYLVMELVDGPSVAVHPPRRLNDVAGVGAQVASALAYVHARGLVHRDVKPANLLTCGRPPAGPTAPGAYGGGGWPPVKLADFGIARLLDSTGITATGTTIGTAAYLAPEQVRGEPVGPAADIWSLGLILLECLTGQRTYPGSPAESAVARLHRPPEIPPSLPETWRELLSAMTRTDPAARPAATEVAEGLTVLASEPAAVPAAARRRDPAEPEMLWGPPVAPVGVASAAIAATAAGAVGDAPATAVMGGLPVRSDRWREMVRQPWFRPAAVAACLLIVALVGMAIVGTAGRSDRSGPAHRPPAATPVTTAAPTTTAPTTSTTAAPPARRPAPKPDPGKGGDHGD